MPETEDFLTADGEMTRAIRDHDWAATPLGPIAGWPSALKVAVGMMVNSHFPKCICWGPELIAIYNDGFRPILGNKPAALGRPFSEIWAEVWDQIGPIAQRALAGKAAFFEDMPLVIDRYGRPEQAWFTFCYSPIRDEQGRIGGIIDTVIETTSKMETQRNSRLLNAELAHRMKNIMAMVAAVAGQTFRSAHSLEEAQESFAERIATLGQAHDILTRSSWSGAPIDEVVGGALAPHRIPPEAVRIEGPPLQLAADHALTLALAINELTTNAIKYGALSVEGGRIALSWRTVPGAEGPRFHLDWVESGGPPVRKPERAGFGSRLVERVVAQKFRGEVSLDYAQDGLRYSLVTALDNLAPPETGEAG